MAKSFANCVDLTGYLNTCYKYIIGNGECLPKCFIRIDVSHMIKLIYRWESLRRCLPRVRELYLRKLAFIYQCDSFDTVTHVFESLMTICLSETDGINIKPSNY